MRHEGHKGRGSFLLCARGFLFAVGSNSHLTAKAKKGKNKEEKTTVTLFVRGVREVVVNPVSLVPHNKVPF
jgi:hypothetical protein